MDLSRWQSLLAAARGDIEADLLLEGGKVVNVFSARIEELPVAVYDGRVVGFGDYRARQRYDLKGAYLVPGFIDGHIHIESSKLTPPRFAETVIPHGTSAVVADPHEIANVWGLDGIRYMIESSRKVPLDFFYMLPSCVPATDMETSGARLEADDLKGLLNEPEVLGIGEVMNFPGAYLGDPGVLAKIALASGRMPVDGHSPGLSDRNLAAYLAAGPSSDHECISYEEAAEKLARGMTIMIREGSTARNLDALMPLVTATAERRCIFVSDDRRPGDLLTQGHLDHILRRAVGLGLDPLIAIRMVTLNSAEHFGLKGRGAIRPGWLADMVAVADLAGFEVIAVWKGGSLVASEGKYRGAEVEAPETAEARRLPVPEPRADAFDVPDRGGEVRVIGVIPDQIVTRSLSARLPSSSGLLTADIERDIVKLTVIERYSGRGGMAVGFVKGLGLRQGAIASTVAHDSHNVIAAGADDRSLRTAVGRLIEMGGGQVAARGEAVIAELPLPVAGLMSTESAVRVSEREDGLISAARSLGCTLADPFMVLGFLALPVIPELKLTDRGLVDVGRFDLIPLHIAGK